MIEGADGVELAVEAHGDRPAVLLVHGAAPTLGVWSSGDRYLSEEQMERSGEQVTGPWRYERIEGAGHWMQLDAPERVTTLLLEHLNAT